MAFAFPNNNLLFDEVYCIPFRDLYNWVQKYTFTVFTRRKIIHI